MTRRLTIAASALLLFSCDADLRKLHTDGGSSSKGGSGGSGGQGGAGGGGSKDGPGGSGGGGGFGGGGGSAGGGGGGAGGGSGKIVCSDPVNNTGCPASQKCTLDCTMSTGFVCAGKGAKGNDEPCSGGTTDDCAAGYVCVSFMMASPRCARFCNGNTDCASGYGCTGSVRCSSEPPRAKICVKP